MHHIQATSSATAENKKHMMNGKSESLVEEVYEQQYNCVCLPDLEELSGKVSSKPGLPVSVVNNAGIYQCTRREVQCLKGPIGPLCEQDACQVSGDCHGSPVPKGPATAPSNSSIDSSRSPSPSPARNVLHFPPPLPDDLFPDLPDLETLPSWRNTRIEHEHPAAGRPSSECVSCTTTPVAAAACLPPPSGWREGSGGWQSALRVGVATLSAVLIVDHGQLRTDRP
jgi:hypothetical protein